MLGKLFAESHSYLPYLSKDHKISGFITVKLILACGQCEKHSLPSPTSFGVELVLRGPEKRRSVGLDGLGREYCSSVDILGKQRTPSYQSCPTSEVPLSCPKWMYHVEKTTRMIWMLEIVSLSRQAGPLGALVMRKACEVVMHRKEM